MGGGLEEGAPRRWDHLGVGATHPLLPLCADTPPSPIPVFLGVRSPGPNWEEMGSRTAAESQALMGKSAAGGPREPRDSPSARAPGSPGAVAKSERGLGKPRSPRPRAAPAHLARGAPGPPRPPRPLTWLRETGAGSALRRPPRPRRSPSPPGPSAAASTSGPGLGGGWSLEGPRWLRPGAVPAGKGGGAGAPAPA